MITKEIHSSNVTILGVMWQYTITLHYSQISFLLHTKNSILDLPVFYIQCTCKDRTKFNNSAENFILTGGNVTHCNTSHILTWIQTCAVKYTDQ